MNRPKPPLDYSRPDDREREPPQWWVFALIIAVGIAIYAATAIWTLRR